MIRVGSSRSEIAAMKPRSDFQRNSGAQFINRSWKQILPLVSEKLYTIAKKNPNGVVGVIGQFIDEETILTFKRLLNQLGIESSNISIQNSESKWNKNINIDFRANHLLNKKLNTQRATLRLFETPRQEAIGDAGACDYVLLIGSTPRYEASL